MLRILKACTIALGLFLIALGVALFFLLPNAQGHASEVATETLGSVFGATVDVDGVMLSPRDGALILRDVVVWNPPRYKDDYALRAETVRIRFAPVSLFTSTPIIESLALDGVEVNYRYEIGQGTNIGALSRHAAEIAERQVGEREYKIKAFRCEAAKVRFSANVVPLARMKMRVVTVEIADLEKQPVTTGQLTSIFLRSLVRETLSLKGLLNPAFSKLKEEFGRSEQSGAAR